MARKVRETEEDAAIDMTPMLDIVFILLIFFIVTAMFVKEPGIEVERPETQLQEREKPTLLVAVSADQTVRSDDGGRTWANVIGLPDGFTTTAVAWSACGKSRSDPTGSIASGSSTNSPESRSTRIQVPTL